MLVLFSCTWCIKVFSRRQLLVPVVLINVIILLLSFQISQALLETELDFDGSNNATYNFQPDKVEYYYELAVSSIAFKYYIRKESQTKD